MSDVFPDERAVEPAHQDPDETDRDHGETENTGTAPLVAGHAADGLGTGEPGAAAVADPARADGGMPTATPSDAKPEESDLEDAPVFDSDSATSYRQRWSKILTEFIDDPHRAVEDADRFVADIAQAFAAGVESRRQNLSSVREQDGHDQTEDLRLTMRQYRMLVDQMLTGSAASD
jgi:hypothetical protein